MNATIQLTHIGTDNTATVLGNRNELITLLHQAFLEVPTFKSVCTEALLTFDTEAAASMPSLFEEQPYEAVLEVFEIFEIPEKYQYFAINSLGMGIAFKGRPILTRNGWVTINGEDIEYGNSSESWQIIGENFNSEGWETRLFKRGSHGYPAIVDQIR